MSLPNNLEQQMLSLINQERADASLAPLTFNGDLNEASEDHSTWMLNTDTFSHTGQNGSSAGDRIVAAGYELEGNWTWGENIGWQSERGAPGLEDDVADIHQSLMNSPGHRANILNPAYDEIGIGIESGDFESFDSVMITQNFGATDAVTDNPDPQQPPAPVPGDPVDDTPDDEDPPVAEGPDDENPGDQDPPVAEGPDDENPDEQDPPVAEGPDDDETPDDAEPPVAEGPDGEAPGEQDPPVAEGPDGDTPDQEDPPVAEGPDGEVPGGDEPPVAEGPDGETPGEDGPPVAEGPDHEPFDVDQFLADLGEMLENLSDDFEFIASGDCETIDMEDTLPMHEDISSQDDGMDQDDMMTTCDEWSADAFDFQIAVAVVNCEFDLA